MINITIIDTYPLRSLIPKKLKLLEMNIDYNFNQNDIYSLFSFKF